MEPSIRYATSYQIYLERLLDKYRKDIINEFDGTSSYFLKPDGSSYEAGEIFVQKDLGQTLNRIKENGHQGFMREKLLMQSLRI